MLHTHLKLAWRNLRKHGAFSLINILGLSLGLAACLLVFAYARFESGYDRGHPHAERLYRVNQTNIWSPQGGVMASTGPALAPVLRDHYPEVEDATRINTPGTQLVRYAPPGGAVFAFNEKAVLAADSNFFEFFACPLREGNPATALRGAGKVVLSPEAARKYFGDGPAVGRVLELGEERRPVEVSGVTEAQPANRHFHFDFLLSMPTNPNVEQMEWSYIWTQMATYVRLRPGVETAALEAKLATVAGQYVAPTFGRLGMDFEEFTRDKGNWNFYLQPVQAIHLHSAGIGNRLGPVGDAGLVRLLRFIALLILLVAVFNFINLATARAGTRAREIGVKKVMGARRGGLVRQFLIESVLVTALATGLALLLLQVLPYGIARLTGIRLPVEELLQPAWIPLYFAIPLVVGTLAGLYPAFYLSAFRPLQVLQGKAGGGVRTPLLRQVLVTAQFSIAIALVAGAGLVYQQLRYMQTKELGFDREQVLVINDAERLGAQLASFRDEVQQLPGVRRAALAMDMPGRGAYEDFYGREGSDQQLSISQNKIDGYYFSAMGLELAAGRAFEPGRAADRHSVVINETTARLFGWENDKALGRRITYPEVGSLEIIGVVKDFHFQSLRQAIAPLLFFHLDAGVWGDQRVLAIKYAQRDQQELLAALEERWDRMGDDLPFDYSFYDTELARLYDHERRLSSLIALFTGLSLFIAILGLVGLLSFTAEQRRKELGIRKVLGASRLQLFALLNRQYLGLFALAMLLAIPLSWPTLQAWLDDFAYRVDVHPALYLLAGAAVILFSLLSVSYLSLRVAAMNPAEVLQEE